MADSHADIAENTKAAISIPDILAVRNDLDLTKPSIRLTILSGTCSSDLEDVQRVK